MYTFSHAELYDLFILALRATTVSQWRMKEKMIMNVDRDSKDVKGFCFSIHMKVCRDVLEVEPAVRPSLTQYRYIKLLYTAC